jgi:hypothetical protein
VNPDPKNLTQKGLTGGFAKTSFQLTPKISSSTTRNENCLVLGTSRQFEKVLAVKYEVRTAEESKSVTYTKGDLYIVVVPPVIVFGINSIRIPKTRHCSKFELMVVQYEELLGSFEKTFATFPEESEEIPISKGTRVV